MSISSVSYTLQLFILGLLLSRDSLDSMALIDLDKRVSVREVSAQTQLNRPENELVLGDDMRASYQEDGRQSLSFLDYLQKATGYPVRLKFSAQNQLIANELGLTKLILRLWALSVL